MVQWTDNCPLICAEVILLNVINCLKPVKATNSIYDFIDQGSTQLAPASHQVTKCQSTYRPDKISPIFGWQIFLLADMWACQYFLSVDIDLHCLCRRQPTLVSQQVGTICQPMISLPANTTINSAIADKPLDYMQCHGWSPKTRSSHTCYMLTSVVVK